MERWANKVAVVTGAGSGIGAQIVRDLCTNKVIVYGLDINNDGLQKVSSEIVEKDPSSRFTAILCDLTKEEEITLTFNRIIVESAGVDILVNCAGIITNYLLLDEDSGDSVNKVIQTNLMAVISCCRKAFKSMADRDVDGHIVNICSIMGHLVLNVPGKTASAYSVSKFGLNGLNRVLQTEIVKLNKPKIRLSQISPGFVGDTGIRKEADVDFSGAPQLKAKDISDTLMFILSAPTHMVVRDVILQGAGSLDY